MKENDIMKLYKRYVLSLGREDADVCKYYQALQKKLVEDFKENPLKQDVEVDALHRTLQVVIQKDLRLKDLSQLNGCFWSTSLSNDFRNRLRDLQKAFEDSIGWTDRESAPVQRFMTKMGLFIKFVEDVRNPYQQMYFWLSYSNTEIGEWLLRRDGDEAFKHINLLLQQEVVDSSVELSETEAEAAQT